MNEIVKWDHKVPFTDYHDVLYTEKWWVQLLCDAGILLFVVCSVVACIFRTDDCILYAVLSAFLGFFGAFVRFGKLSTRPCHAELWFCSECLLLYYPRRYYTKHKAVREAYTFRYDSLSRCVFHAHSKTITLEGCAELYTYRFDKWNRIGDKCSTHKVYETQYKLDPPELDYKLLVAQIQSLAPVNMAEWQD